MGVTDNLTDPAVIARPYEYFGEIRESEPVYWNEKWGGWIVTRYDDVRHCLQDDEHLSVQVEADRLRDSSLDIPVMKSMFPKWVFYLDPPDHTKLRRVIGEAFNPAMVKEQRSKVETATQTLIDDIERRDPEEIELIEEFAYPLPVRIITRILGLPLDDKQQLGEWSSDIALTLFHHYNAENRHQRTEESIEEFAAYVREVVQRREEAPREDLITYLNEAEADGMTLDQDEVVATVVGLLFAGHETTTKLLANGTLELLRHPDQLDMLREDPSLAPSAVEEILRYHGPSKSLTRGVKEGFEFHGKQIEAGERVLLSLAAANRDPRKFESPDVFDITRGTMEHVGFGHGTHHCLGAPLARLEARVAFPALVNAFPEMELVDDEVQWTQSPLVRGPGELRLRV
ncbi:cytochrome P450 [Halomarina oriensis]|uniref:Cytochrome P450 n=1 Tax=Halomarina oriensis TaxID=671145 RepID=A0A6B0GPA6_9EURY|nr:cytochrome P450 [Halomarina oriensis]MWG33448.1 cytochrome P450 [Halomarina oriensis]